ncbi:hypothetical protein RF55_13115 [Lasius niger]|uniref:BEN domain-containing protein n=1 Tax=Lasius niger TaxID=67767 RepID=A0A0J7KBC3_LASNI|nr:hypothetical protein RF55_13115 [Lasius niger]
MDDQISYMVCEFPNEEDSISIGYLEWLEKEFTMTELDDIIKFETIVKVRWPKDCDVGPATAMKKKLANCQWEVVATKVRAYGGWIKMREIRDNLEKYGITELDKRDRKQFTKKQTESDSNESEVKETKKGAKQKKFILNVKKGKELLKQYNHKKQKYSSQSKFVDDDESGEENEKSPVYKQSKSQLTDTVTVLNEENKRLRRDNERLRRLRSVNEDLPKIDKMLKDLTVNLQSASCKTESLNHQIDKLQQISKLDLPINNKLKSSSQKSDTCNPESPLEDFPDTPDVAIKVNTHELEHVHDDAADKVKSSDHQSIAEIKTVDLGGPEPCVVNATRLSLCNHTSASKLICEMMSLLFTKEELATSSLTGTVANFHCEKGVAAKKKLDTIKIEAMKAYVKNKFPLEKDFEKIFRKAVQQKCNNAVPRNRGPINNKGQTIN